MKDEGDLEELGELVEVLEDRMLDSNCFKCPLYYSDATYSECLHIYKDLSVDDSCEEILNKKKDEVVRYIFERSLKDG